MNPLPQNRHPQSLDKQISQLRRCEYISESEVKSLCEKAKAHKACIYLYIKEGSIQKAFDLSTSYSASPAEANGSSKSANCSG